MRVLFLLLILSTTFYCCKKKVESNVPPVITAKDTVAEILDYTIDGMSPGITIASGQVDVRFADSVTAPQNLVASFTLSPGCSATIKAVAQTSGITANDYKSYLNYTVKNKSGFVKHWIISSTNNDYTYSWGLGRFLKTWKSNDRAYSWYFTQQGTGGFSFINCGPSCVTMAMKWADAAYNLTPNDARTYFPSNTGLWGFGTIEEYLREHDFDYTYETLGNTADETYDIIKQQVDAGLIGILLIKTEYLRGFIGAAEDPYADNYYPDQFNHFIVVYGYKEVDDEKFLQVNDPWGVPSLHKDGSFKGNNRYYRYEDIFKACTAVENGMCVIIPK